MTAHARDSAHRPTQAEIDATQLTAFIRCCEEHAATRFPDPAAFHAFSVDELRLFWSLFLNWSGVIHEGAPEPVCTDDRCEQAVFFPGLRLGYVENLLRLDGELHAGRPAVTACDGAGRRERLTRGELASAVYRFAGALESLGVRASDRVVAITWNDAQAIVAGLGVAALGASLSTASPDMGAFNILARFRQLDPVVLICHFRDLNPGAAGPLADRLAEVVRALPSLTSIIALDDGPIPDGLGVPVHRLAEAVGQTKPIEPRRFPFNHPLFILFSSGTTGLPKCIIHGAGGTLLEHLKEHRLHGDLRPSDKLMFQTSCSWMMWNWQLSALAVGAEIVVYSGPVKGPDTLWQLVSDEGVTAFGTSPPYLQMCQDAGFSPRATLPLSKLRVVLSTGSILQDHQYDWVSANVGPVPLQSISGGTDIIGCFVLGNPNLPVYRGESQCRSLGLDVQALGARQTEHSLGIGELVCRTPFPSRPLGFHNDPGGVRFHDAYFKQNEGMWSHGDLIEFTSEGSARLHGRSDGVLNVGGFRIGPAEIYRILQGLPGLRETMVVEQQTPGAAAPSRLVLLVVLAEGVALDGALKRNLRLELARRGSAAHVPELILAVSQLPVTHSGKRSERAARDVINGRPAANAGALKNPECLDELQRQLKEEEARRASDASGKAHDASPSLETTLIELWERLLDLAPVTPDDNFFALGGTSLLALRMFNELREQTGRDLPPSMLFDAPTVARLAAAITAAAQQPFSSLVSLKVGANRLPLFFVHGLAGDILELRALADHLPSDLPVFGFRAVGIDGRQQPHTRVAQMAACYVEELRARQPVGPYRIVGYSFGGLIAFEMGRLLHEAGQQVQLIGLLDSELHDANLAPLDRISYRLLRKVYRGTSKLSKAFPVVTPFFGPLRGAIRRQLHATIGEPPVPGWSTGELTAAMARLEQLGWAAFRAYRPGRFEWPVTYFQAQLRPPDYCDPLPIWRAATGGQLKVVGVGGDHFAMIRDPDVTGLARRLEEQLKGL